MVHRWNNKSLRIIYKPATYYTFTDCIIWCEKPVWYQENLFSPSLKWLLHQRILHKNVVNLPCPALDLLHFSCGRDNLTKLFCSFFRLSGYGYYYGQYRQYGEYWMTFYTFMYSYCLRIIDMSKLMSLYQLVK